MLDLQTVTNEAFSVLLQYMYTANLNLTVQNIGDVYTAARKLGMDGAQLLCVKILTGKWRHEVHSVYVFVTAKRLGLEEASQRALRTMCKRFEQIVGTQEFLDLNYFQVIEYLSADSLATRSEVIVYLGALKWISVQYFEREQFLVDVIGCVRFPMMTLNEILACHSPPLLPGVVEIPEINQLLLKGTCFIAAKSINEEKRFLQYSCPTRTYLLDREPIILWDPSIFDPDRYALYAEEVAASTIQAGFRGHQTRKYIQRQTQAAKVIQKAFRTHYRTAQNNFSYNNTFSNKEPDNEEFAKKDLEDLEAELDLSEEYDIQHHPRRSPSGTEKQALAERIRKSITSFFRRSSNHLSEDGSKVTFNTRKANDEQKGTQHRNNRSLNHLSSDDILQWVDKSTLTSQSLHKLASSVWYGCIVLTGGFNSIDMDDPNSGKLIILYDPGTNKWTEMGKMPKARHHHRAVYFNGTVYCIGGCNPAKTKNGVMVPVRTCYAFDLPSKKWKKIAKMHHCRMYHAAAELNGKIYVVSGKDALDRILDTIEVYDPEKDYWSVLPNVLESPTMGAAACAYNGKLWVLGGMTQDAEGKIKVAGTVTCYDPFNDEWTHTTRNLPYPRAFVGAVECGKRVYAIGGTAYENTGIYATKLCSLEDVIYYDEIKNKWKVFTCLPSARHFVAALSVGLSLFVIGGLTSLKKIALDEVLIFDEDNNEWHGCTPLPYALCGFAAVSIPKIA